MLCLGIAQSGPSSPAAHVQERSSTKQKKLPVARAGVTELTDIAATIRFHRCSESYGTIKLEHQQAPTKSRPSRLLLPRRTQLGPSQLDASVGTCQTFLVFS